MATPYEKVSRYLVLALKGLNPGWQEKNAKGA